jgi:hypothetical protein
MTATKVRKARPQPPRRRALTARRQMSLWEVLHTLGGLCGTCAGRRRIWCPGCCGFGGCVVCSYLNKVPCPACAGGRLDPIRW